MNKSIKKNVRSVLVVILALCFVPQSRAFAYGNNVISDPFSYERPVYDVNIDGKFNILDLVRLKKYISGAAVTADLSVFAAETEKGLISDWKIFAPNYTTVSQALVAPLPSLSANGICVSPKNGSRLETADNSSMYSAGRNIYAAAQLNTPECISSGDGVIFYLKTDAANTVLPMLPVSDPKITSYKPDMALKVGAEYFYMEIGGSWQTAAVAETGYSARPGYFGLISFDKAFEGYVKIPFKSLSNDAAAAAVLDDENYIERFICIVKGLGGDYGNVVFGPFFIYSDNSYAQALAAVKAALLESK